MADAVEEEGLCSNPECSYSEDGVCVARGDVQECEFFEPITHDDGLADELGPATVALPSGEALAPDQIDRVLADTPANTVVPLGLTKAGKTTLLCLLFDQLRTGRVQPWKFARSKTIVGFARRGYDSSMRSGRTEGTTPRTSQLESGMSLHVGCRDCAGKEHNLLLIDLSGEHVAQLANGNPPGAVVAALERADHVPIVVDGGQIADRDQRAAAVYSARSILGAIDLQAIPDHASVSVVITKGDLLVNTDTDAIFDEITRGTRAKDAPWILTADRESAALDDEGHPIVERGLGVDRLLGHITTGPDPVRGTWPKGPGPIHSTLLARLWRRA